MKKIVLIVLLLITLGLSYYCFFSDYSHQNEAIYFGGDIITMRDSTEHPEAIYVKNGKIEAVGNFPEIEKLKTDNTKLIDLQGNTLLPGFFDSHGHFDLATVFASMIDISGLKYRNPAEVWQIMEKESQKAEAGKWLFFYGFDPVLTKGIRSPTIQYLDSISLNKPLVVVTKALHVFYANSLAFKELGISEKTPNPTATSYYEKDAQGKLNGGVVEQAAIEPFSKKIQEIAKLNFLPNTQKVLDNYAALGVTSVVNMGGVGVNKNVLNLYEHLAAEKPKPLFNLLQLIGKLPKRQPNQRVFVYLKKELEQFLPESSDNGDDFFRVLGIKFWYDGSPYAGSMYLKKPYIQSVFTTDDIHLPKNHTSHAMLKPEDLQLKIEKYQSKGFQVAIHAQGDIANEEVIEVFENIHKKTPLSKYRHRIEHCMLLPTTSLAKMKQMGISPSFHINHLLYYGEFLGKEVLGEERAKLIFPIGSVANLGIPYTLHADMPQFIPNPLSLASTSVNRKTEAGLSVNENEKVSVWQALRSITIDAAWQLHLEEKLGSIEKGKYADFVILDKNPLKTPHQNLAKIQVLNTIVAGNEIWRKDKKN